MKVSDIDKNFEVKTVEKTQDCDYYDAKQPPFNFSGGFYEEENKKFVRVPTALAEKISRGVSILGNITAGMRVRFSTDSDFIELKVTYEKYFRMNTAPLTASAGFSLMEDLPEGGQAFTQIFFPDEGDDKGFIQRKALKGGKVRNYTLYFPLYNDLKSVEIGVKAASFVGSGKAYKNVKPVLWYGSSITQGCCVSRPDNTYEAIISKRNNIDFFNLGFSGNAKGEKLTGEFLTTFDCSLFICEYDYNSDEEELSKNHYELYKLYREKRRETPILFVTRPNTDGEEDKTARRREIIYKTYDKALTNGDKKVYYLDGSCLFGENDRENCTIDGCHPTDLGAYRIAEKIYGKLGEISKDFL